MPWSLGRSPQPGLGHPGVSLGHPNIWCWALKANKDRVGEAGNLIPTNPSFCFFKEKPVSRLGVQTTRVTDRETAVWGGGQASQDLCSLPQFPSHANIATVPPESRGLTIVCCVLRRWTDSHCNLLLSPFIFPTWAPSTYLQALF